MDMNQVCLRFDALKKLPVTGKLIKICQPVYSNPIKNSSKLKIQLSVLDTICNINIFGCKYISYILVYVVG